MTILEEIEALKRIASFHVEERRVQKEDNYLYLFLFRNKHNGGYYLSADYNFARISSEFSDFRFVHRVRVRKYLYDLHTVGMMVENRYKIIPSYKITLEDCKEIASKFSMGLHQMDPFSFEIIKTHGNVYVD